MVEVVCGGCGLVAVPMHCGKPMDFTGGKLKCAGCGMTPPELLKHCGNDMKPR